MNENGRMREVYICMHVRMHACMHAQRLSVCLPACLPVCRTACRSEGMFVSKFDGKDRRWLHGWMEGFTTQVAASVVLPRALLPGQSILEGSVFGI